MAGLISLLDLSQPNQPTNESTSQLKKLTEFLKNIVRIGSAIVLFGTFLAYLCPHVNPENFPWISFFGTAFPWLALLNLFFFLLWAWRRNRFAFYHLGILLLGWNFISSLVGLDFGKKTLPENSICVATQNLGSIYYKKGRITTALKEKTVNGYANFLMENGAPDILCTQETRGDFYHALAQKMNYPHTFNLRKGTVIYSRFEMAAGGDIPFGRETWNSTIWVDIQLPSKKIRVYNVHLESNHVTDDTNKVIEDGDLEEEKTWGEIGGILGKVGLATQTRAQQAGLLRDHILKCPYPVVLCGDFNDTPNSYVYRILAEQLTDTFREKGLGIGSTYGGTLPFLRIDYILIDPKMKVFSCHRAKSTMTFSDHYPVFAEVGF